MSEDEELVTSGGARSDDRGGFTGTSSGMRPEESQDCEAWLSATEETDDTCAKEVEADDGDCQDCEAWMSTSEETDDTCAKEVEVDDGDCQDWEAWLSTSEETDDTCAKEVEVDEGD